MKTQESQTMVATREATHKTEEARELALILEHIQSGTPVQMEKACMALRNKYLKQITTSLVYRMGGFPEIVASGVTDAFIVLWKNLRSGAIQPSEIQNAKAYLYDLARKKVIDHLRTNGRWKEEAYFSTLSPATMSGLGYSPVQQRTGSKLELTSTGWEVCQRHFLQGETITEISEQMGITRQTVKKEISKGKKQAGQFGKVNASSMQDMEDDDNDTDEN